MGTVTTPVNPVAIQSDQQLKQYGGIRRGWYFVGTFVLGILSQIFNAGEEGLATAGMLIMIPLWFILVVSRLRNIGMSGKWSLLIIVPIANLFVGITCLICQEGYQETRKLDKAGKIAGSIILGLIVLIVIAIIISALTSTDT
jgi:hypothetical protein